MIFELKFRSASNKAKYAYKSAVQKFLFDNNSLKEEIEEFESDTDLKINKVLREQLIKEKKINLELVKPDGKPDLIFIQKVDISKSFTADFFRDCLSAIIPKLKDQPLQNLHIFIPAYSLFPDTFDSEEYYYQTFVEGILLGNYTFDIYKTEEKKVTSFQITFHSGDPRRVKEAITKAEKTISAVYFARDLANEPAITLTPNVLAQRAKKELSEAGVKVTIFNDKELKKRNMNAILAVGKASSNPPRLIIMHYKPKSKAKKKIVLVGKGVTYDSGGLSIKPTDGMIEMKADMAGAAAVIGIIKSAALLNLPFELIGVVPAVENMISGNSYKPSDIVSTASGKTIEVKNTDAEGRIVLADALEYASKQKPDEIIDFATLTGAAVVALGLSTAAIFTKNEEMADSLYKSGQKTFERVWRLPLWDEYDKLIESDIADVSNLGGRWGGAITAAKFLEHFVDKNIPWTHVDLAGPSIKHDFTNYTKKYNTGFGVRLITDYLERLN